AVLSEDMRKLILLVATVAFAQRPFPPAGMQCPQRTLVLIKIDAAPASKINQYYDEETAVLIAPMKSAQLISAAPPRDGGGGFLFATADWNEVQQIMKKEPFPREGITTIASHTVWQACEAAR